MGINKISFFPSDSSPSHLASTADKIAEFLLNYKTQLRNFVELMRLSAGWKKNNYMDGLQSWTSTKKGRRKQVAQDVKVMCDLAVEFFSVCRNDLEITKIRGLVPEKIVEKIFLERYCQKKERKLGFGMGVSINGKSIKYVCSHSYSNSDDSDGNRQSVDAGAWDGQFGEFAEVKFRPEAFHTKDVKYLHLLSSELNSANCKHVIYLVSMGEKNLTESRLRDLQLWNPNEFTLIGREELLEMRCAI